MSIHLSREDILAIHVDLIEKFGGDKGIRDIGALESAIGRLQTGYYKDIVEETAALMESLAINHPFVDGNKRIAFFCSDVFLRLNGFYIECENEKAHDFIIGLFESNKFKFDELHNWLRKHVKPLRK
ncbi:MAG: type II toxin-antitoxin system death-on-curing family toxin [Gammaproteobacteria bacterium]|nr:MAG: type II toxin-antitoxin system death-on-curing family toxin [Gammaproteobacteria bacterium]